ncbi:MAG TPA: (2Fe-2S) ferredoxin domain-containing protein [Spirochaetia bacterium]|nr:(2Fe-2S) ferredoxin domain-containing protein [Spirochaetia bacterium]
MDKIRSLQDILAIREQAQKKTALREDGFTMCFTVHMGTCGIASGAREVVNELAAAVEESGRTDIRLTTSGCIGACEHEPVMTVETLGAQPVLYGHLDAKKAREVFTKTITGKSAAAYVVYVGTEPSDAEKAGKAEKRQGRARA